MSSQPIGTFVATMTGAAEICAEEITTALAAAGVEAETPLMDAIDTDALRAYKLIVIVLPTYGHSDIPDNVQALFKAIEATESLASVRLAVFGLGDRTYAATFCEAGQKWDALLAEKGASRFAPLVQHDACSGTLAEDVAAEWAAQFKQAA